MRKRIVPTVFGLIIFYPLLIFAAFSDKAVENVKSATVAIYLDENLNYLRASGFFIDSSGVIITAKHAVQDYPRLWALLYDGRKLELILAGFQENDDLAIMFPKVNEASVFPYLKFSGSSDLAIGKPVMAVGNSFGGLWQILYGNIVNLRKEIFVKNDNPELKKFNSTIEYDIFISKGFSGGPLVDENGNVLGVNIAVGENLSYAISLLEVKSFIKEFYRNSPELIKKF